MVKTPFPLAFAMLGEQSPCLLLVTGHPHGSSRLVHHAKVGSQRLVPFLISWYLFHSCVSRLVLSPFPSDRRFFTLSTK